MSFVFDGVTIPADLANAFTWGSTDVTKIYANSVLVWEQSLFGATWSGSSVAGSSTGLYTSGSNMRYQTSGNVGAWATAYSDGTFSNTNSCFDYGGCFGYYIRTVANMRYYEGGNTGTGPVYFTPAGGFTASSVKDDSGLYTSGGAIRARAGSVNGGWITLD